ncbi:hypothetical protein, partial [Enterobacter intestinihominis]
AFVVAFFMSGGGVSFPDLRVGNFCWPGYAEPPPRKVLKLLHKTQYKPLSEYSLLIIAFILVFKSYIL